MKRAALITTLAMAGLGATLVFAQTTPETKQPPRATAGTQPRAGEHRGAGDHGMAGGGMGSGMGMGGGMCPMMMVGPDTRISVQNVAKGVSITLTSDDSGAVPRLQKMAEAWRLMHEAMAH